MRIWWKCWKVFRIVRCRKYFRAFFNICELWHKIHHFCTLHQTLLKQSSNGANFGQNRKKSTFCSKITFWAQKCILGSTCTFGSKGDFWAQSAILSKKCTLELSRTHIQVTFFAIWPPWYPKKQFCSKNNFLTPKSHFCTFCDFGPQSALFAWKCTFPSPCRGCL